MTPVVAVLDELKKQSSEEIDVRFVCDRGFAPQARSIMAGATVPVQVVTISAGKFRRYKHFSFMSYVRTPSVTLKNMVDVVKFGAGFFEAFWHILRFRPDVVFAKGGFVCLPVGWAARITRVPLVIHDSDARPGLTNRLLAPFATSIATGYPLENYPYDKARSTYTGVPIRAGCEVVSPQRQQKAKEAFSVDASDLLIVGVGGGLGSRAINAALVEAAGVFEGKHVKIVIIAGVKQYTETLEAARSYSHVEVLEFVAEGMIELLSAADIIVTRASATSLQELAGLAKAIVAVPARQLTDQHRNAALYEKANAAIVLDDDALEAGALTTELQRLVADSETRSALAHRLHEFARPEAARDVAQLIGELAKKN